MLTSLEKERYNRHIIIDQFGIEAQEKLKQASVMIVGAGGLGCPIIQYLTAAGIGKIGIADADVVNLSNLQRQILFTEAEIGQSKAEVVANKMQKLNSNVQFQVYNQFITETNADELFAPYQIIVGATDNFASRLIIDQYTKQNQKPFVHGSILEFEGQVATFNYQGGNSYNDLFPQTGNPSSLPLGVVGALPGIIGSLMALEIIKIITNIGETLSHHILLYNGLNNKTIKLKR